MPGRHLLCDRPHLNRPSLRPPLDCGLCVGEHHIQRRVLGRPIGPILCNTLPAQRFHALWRNRQQGWPRETPSRHLKLEHAHIGFHQQADEYLGWDCRVHAHPCQLTPCRLWAGACTIAPICFVLKSVQIWKLSRNLLKYGQSTRKGNYYSKVAATP